MIIDFEQHFFMKDQVEPISSESGKLVEHPWDENGMVGTRRFVEASYIDRFLRFMDESGIDMAVLTSNFVNGFDQMKRWNDYCAKIVKEYPKRFLGYACIPPLGGKPAFEELRRAVEELGLKGVHIWTWTDGKTMDNREMWPFYEQICKYDIPIDVHVTMRPPGYEVLNAPWGLYFCIARELDMCVTVFRVCLGGVLEDFPELKLIMNHFGGGVSAIMERIDADMTLIGSGLPSEFYREKPLITRPWREYFDKLYFNIAGRELGMAAMKCALTTIKPERLVFGTDWPFNFDYRPEEVREYIAEIRKLDLPPQQIEAILGDNAARLLGINQ